MYSSKYVKILIKMSGIPSVLYDAKSKLAETWRNCTADDSTQSISSAWRCVYPNDSALRQPVEILWIGLAGSKSRAKKFYPSLQWRMWLTCIIIALGYWWCSWVWLFCLMDCCQVLAFLDFLRKQRYSVTFNGHLNTDELLLWTFVCNPEYLRPLCVFFQSSVPD